jgi:beta-ureidopropionase / N-carbamoyl-L-amino-acid hydrolase
MSASRDHMAWNLVTTSSVVRNPVDNPMPQQRTRSLAKGMGHTIDKAVVDTLSAAIDQQRLWQWHLDLARFGARPDGGVNRQALSEHDIAARDYLIAIAQRHGFQCTVDPMGNLFIRREGTAPEMAPVMTGSHLDSQVAGGKFDGAFGVLAGLEVLFALESTGLKTRRSIEVACWTNEEGSRFAPGVMGSSAFVGAMSLSDILPVQDIDGVTVEQALNNILQATPTLAQRPLGFPVAAYIEAHIEQGPILCSAARPNSSASGPVGIVTGIQGTRWLNVEVLGAEAHSGTTPMNMRKDAFKIANQIITTLQKSLIDPQGLIRFTVGRMNIEPNAINTIPGRVTFTIDLRHPQLEVLTKLHKQVVSLCQSQDSECAVTVTEIMAMDPIVFNSELIELLDNCATTLDLPHMPLASGAFHDARLLSQVAPSAMIFIPCEDGVSHNPNEYATASDIAAGTQLLAVALARLAQIETD